MRRCLLLSAAVAAASAMWAGAAGACPKCRLGAAALTGSQSAGPVAQGEGTGGAVDHADASPGAAEGATTTTDDPLSSARPLDPFFLTGGVNVTTAYFHRGYLQEDQGLITQPYLTLSAVAHERDDVIVTPYVTSWNSFHENQTFSDGDYDAWYESELMVGVAASKGPASIDLKYTLYSYPNGALSQIQEFGAKFGYDLAALWTPNDPRTGRYAAGDFVLPAWVLVAKETQDRNGPPTAAPSAAASTIRPGGLGAGTNRPRLPHEQSPRAALQRSGGQGGVGVFHAPIFHQPAPDTGVPADELAGFDTSTQGTYLEFGVEPSMRLRAGRTALGLSFPVVVGTSPDGYYQESGGGNDFLGYASGGVQVTVPLPVGERFGRWYLSGSVTYLHFFADSLEFANSGSQDEVIGTLGVSFSY